jgi:hypothetical protein
MAEWVSLPPRAEQTADRLIEADAQAAMERRRGGEEPIMAYVARQVCPPFFLSPWVVVCVYTPHGEENHPA